MASFYLRVPASAYNDPWRRTRVVAHKPSPGRRMPVRRGAIEGLLIIERPTIEDARGFFRESFRLNELEEALGRPIRFVQENHARSGQRVLRGLHAENWQKLIYVARGEVFTAVADIRPASPTFGSVDTFTLGESNRSKLFLPAAVAHGYCVVSEEADYVYLVTEYYDGTDTAAVAWDDPDLAVPWPITDPILSGRDRHNPSLRELYPDRYRRV